jgi:dTDP-4-amino-4,6-dideoxygalactose transaminase
MPEQPMIPVAKPWLGEEEAAAARRPILAGWVTQGLEVAAFEKEFADAVGAAHACAVSNCTTALHLALRAVGVGPGDEVITVSHSFIATANAIRYCGAIPVFVDIDGATFNLDPALIDRAVSPRTRAILCVHQMGMPCDLASILEIAERYSLPVIEDAACAIGSEIEWRGRWERVGKPHGVIACFSFHPRKIVTTGDGGMLTTSDPELDKKFRLWRQHSMSVSDAVRHQSSRVTFEAYPELGYNYRLTDIQAALGREQLRKLPEMVEKRRALADRYRVLLSCATEVIVPYEPRYARTNWQSYCVRLASHFDQTAVMQYMLERGVSTRRGIMCSHREPAYAERESWRCGGDPCSPFERCSHLRGSEKAQDDTIILPLYHQMSESDQDRVVESLLQATNRMSLPGNSEVDDIICPALP